MSSLGIICYTEVENNIITRVERKLAKYCIATSPSGECTRLLCALAASEQCLAPTADECKHSFAGAQHPPCIQYFTVGRHLAFSLMQKCPFPRGITPPQLKKVSSITGVYIPNGISLGRFRRFCTTHSFAQYTDTRSPSHRHTDPARGRIRPHLCTASRRCGLMLNSYTKCTH